ncbi:MAG: hypothetical protein J0L70_18285 [Leptolyngbya sp. UWPOB_LEPTO1]|uniref:hypothetical protein n=1 Tax=Leptolyngbya sp. UWPOB_LEPTO1 TaxID=2815653 RepID=UPI001AC04292|nr:hypothetical protein [Leptolyngbya sp. UWPOB_LEPTO1]MBN8562484.1 hypothetical protein [Leptolyngbya sp. UWPOB_LEPTO1]
MSKKLKSRVTGIAVMGFILFVAMRHAAYVRSLEVNQIPNDRPAITQFDQKR